MYKFGKTSLEKLKTCHPDLIKVAKKAIKLVDFSIVSGHRGKEEQDRYFRNGVSKLTFPNSKHNQYPSLAFDFAPYPTNWNDTKQFTYVAGVIMGVAIADGISLRWGNDWNLDGVLGTKKDFNDYGHIEIYERRNKNK